MANIKDPTKVAGIFVAVLIVLVSALVLVATVNRKPQPPLLISFVEDASLSTLSDHTCLRRSVSEAIGKSPDRIEFRYSQTGNAATAFEPLQPVEPLKINKDDIPWAAGPGGMTKLIDEFLAKIPSPRRRTEKSPLFNTVERAVSDVRSREQDRRVVIVACDLEDTMVPALMAAFKQAPGTRISGLPQINNTGVEVRFVSIDSTVGQPEGSNQKFTAPRTPERIKRLQEVWKACFTAPELVTFSPTCNDPIQG